MEIYIQALESFRSFIFSQICKRSIVYSLLLSYYSVWQSFSCSTIKLECLLLTMPEQLVFTSGNHGIQKYFPNIIIHGIYHEAGILNPTCSTSYKLLCRKDYSEHYLQVDALWSILHFFSGTGLSGQTCHHWAMVETRQIVPELYGYFCI